MINRRDKIDIVIGWVIIGDAIRHLSSLIVYKVFQILFGLILIIGFAILYFIDGKNNEKYYRENIVYLILIFFLIIISLAYCKYIR
jgi:hypothetical protein